MCFLNKFYYRNMLSLFVFDHHWGLIKSHCIEFYRMKLSKHRNHAEVIDRHRSYAENCSYFSWITDPETVLSAARLSRLRALFNWPLHVPNRRQNEESVERERLSSLFSAGCPTPPHTDLKSVRNMKTCRW